MSGETSEARKGANGGSTCPMDTAQRPENQFWMDFVKECGPSATSNGNPTSGGDPRDLRLLLDSTGEGIFRVNREARCTFINKAGAAMLGYSVEEFMGRNMCALVQSRPLAGSINPPAECPIAVVFRTGKQSHKASEVFHRRDGSSFPVEYSCYPICEDGEITGAVINVTDITERKKLEAESNLRERRLNAFFTGATAGLALRDANLRYVQINETLAHIHNIPVECHIGKTLEELMPDLAPVFEPMYRAVLASGQPKLNWEMAEPAPTNPATPRQWMGSYFPIPGEDGRCDGVGAIVVDITARKQMEDSLRESERRFRDLLGNVELIAMTLDCAGTMTFCNDYLLKITGWDRAEVVGASWFDRFIPESEKAFKRLFFEKMQNGGIPRQHQNAIKSKDGRLRQILWHNTMLKDNSGNITGAASIGEDVTERHAAEEALRESDLRFRQFAENINSVFWMSDKDVARILYVSPAYEKVWGRSRQNVYESPLSYAEAAHPEDRSLLENMRERQKRGEDTDEEFRIIRPDGTTRWIRDRAFAIRDQAGAFYRIAGISEDVTEHKELAQQMRQAQKMESIGQLAGGVAHDFNNILMVIQGNAALIEEEEGLPAHVLSWLREIAFAAGHAATLTRQLLTFSRRQVMQPRRLRLNEVVEGVAKMLRRVLGEDIALKLELAPISDVVGDAGMVEQILMNLAVNARDAMPHGGWLKISTSAESLDESRAQKIPEALAGNFVCISVADSGCGIDEENLPKIFEPFFTTKEVGKGTGLGLATVYGIVKQHRGWITVESEFGKGTIFRIYFPAAAVQQSESADGASTVEKIRGGNETILLVEDEKVVRELVRRVLEAWGYKVIEADSGPTALHEWQNHGRKIDLLLTDIVMPGGMSGRALAEQLRLEKPGLPVVFTSGYSGDLVGKQFAAREGTSFLQKPYVPRMLATCVRSCLDRGSRNRAGSLG